MAKYTINVPASGGTITAATYNSCITALTMDTSADPDNIVDTTGATNGNFTIHCTANRSSQSREWTYALYYNHSGGMCEHDLHVVQEGGQEEPHYIYITLTGNMSGRYSDYVTFVLSNGMTYQANYASTSGAFSDKRVKMDIPSGDLTITGVSVTDSLVAHMGYPAQLVSGSDTYLKDNGRYTINVIN